MSDKTLPATMDELGPPERALFFRRALSVLRDANVPYLVGGSYALQKYTGVVRHTKDIDLFVRPADCRWLLDVLARAGFRTELTDPNWLGKAFHEAFLVDIVFNSGNGICPVDDGWFEHAPHDEVLGVEVRLCPVEEMIWQKAYIMERERFDGADIAHLLRARGAGLDWQRLLNRMEPHWQVLLSHVILFRYIYPAEGQAVPDWVLENLAGRTPVVPKGPDARRTFRGTLLSRYQYQVDLDAWGYLDARAPGARQPAAA